METWPAHDPDARLSWSVPCTTPPRPEDPSGGTSSDADSPVPEQDGGAGRPVADMRHPEDDAAINDTVRVLVLGDRVGVVLPPGDTLVFTREEANYLAITLDRAAEYT